MNIIYVANAHIRKVKSPKVIGLTSECHTFCIVPKPLSPSSVFMHWLQLNSNQTQTLLKSCLHVPGATESSSEASQLEVPCPEFPVIFLRILSSGMRYQLSSAPDLKLQKARRQPINWISQFQRSWVKLIKLTKILN